MLVVEDDAATAAFLAENLIADGVRAAVATSVGEALRAIEVRRPDAVFLDLGLADGSGLIVLDAVRGGFVVGRPSGSGAADHRDQRARERGRAGARLRPRGGRLRREAVLVPRAGRAPVGGAATDARPARSAGAWWSGDLVVDPLTRVVTVAGAPSRCRRRSSGCCTRWRSSRRAWCRRRSCCATYGATRARWRRARWTCTRTGCGGSWRRRAWGSWSACGGSGTGWWSRARPDGHAPGCGSAHRIRRSRTAMLSTPAIAANGSPPGNFLSNG